MKNWTSQLCSRNRQISKIPHVFCEFTMPDINQNYGALLETCPTISESQRTSVTLLVRASFWLRILSGRLAPIIWLFDKETIRWLRTRLFMKYFFAIEAIVRGELPSERQSLGNTFMYDFLINFAEEMYSPPSDSCNFPAGISLLPPHRALSAVIFHANQVPWCRAPVRSSS